MKQSEIVAKIAKRVMRELKANPGTYRQTLLLLNDIYSALRVLELSLGKYAIRPELAHYPRLRNAATSLASVTGSIDAARYDVDTGNIGNARGRIKAAIDEMTRVELYFVNFVNSDPPQIGLDYNIVLGSIRTIGGRIDALAAIYRRLAQG